MINRTSSSLVTCITDAILSCENKSFKSLQAARKNIPNFYHHVLLYKFLTMLAIRELGLQKLEINKQFCNTYHSLEL